MGNGKGKRMRQGKEEKGTRSRLMLQAGVLLLLRAEMELLLGQRCLSDNRSLCHLTASAGMSQIRLHTKARFTEKRTYV